MRTSQLRPLKHSQTDGCDRAAGSDTTAVALRSIFYHILKAPNVYAKLQLEIDEACSHGRLSTPCTFLEASQMPYLSAVCKEGMRVFPSVSMVLPRYVPRGGRVIAGVHLPEKVRPILCQTPCGAPMYCNRI